MSGRAKIKLHHYDLDGNSLGTFESLSEVHSKYYKGSKYPLFKSKDNSLVHLLPDATCITKGAIYRDELRKLIKRFDAPDLIDKYQKYNPIEILNFDKIEIGTFYNIPIASQLLNISQSDIHSIIKASGNEVPKNKYGIYIRYKNLDSKNISEK